MSFETSIDILSIARKAMKNALCDHCLGRIFGKHGHGLSNEERGRIIREKIVAAAGHRSAESEHVAPVHRLLVESLPKAAEECVLPAHCFLCEDFFARVAEFAELALNAISGIEFSTFLVGTKIPADMLEREESLWNEVGTTFGESMKSEMNREIGKVIEKTTGKPADHGNPDVSVLVDTWAREVSLAISPVFIRGRYRKLIRGIPQTHWPCRKCQGSGCERCGGTGKMYQESVEELIGEPAAREFQAEAFTLHGAGREDIDARMLGNGRPFILELKGPRKRIFGVGTSYPDLKRLEAMISSERPGKVEVLDLRKAERREVEELKSAAYPKVYRAVVDFTSTHDAAAGTPDARPPSVPHTRNISEHKLRVLEHELSGVELSQATPRRVVHRRADLVRGRKILELKLENFQGNRATFLITAEAGCYIKEFVSGDEGRTAPSIAEKLGIPARVIELDVVQILDEARQRNST